MSQGKRLIEEHLPVEAINIVAQREKIGHAALHPRKLHLWWARRPLAAARAAVYATLVTADAGPDKDAAAAHFTELCAWGGSGRAIERARAAVLAGNGGVPPKVLDLFSGGGAIPLEALRLGCEATAVELNPVAHLIERCTLEFPQTYGASLAEDVRLAGEQWVTRAWERVGHLYPTVRPAEDVQTQMGHHESAAARAAGRPIAYLWTRTVPCPNPAREPHDVALVRQTWLAKKTNRFVALKPHVDAKALTVNWEVVEAQAAEELGFDPAAFAKRSGAACLVCGATVGADYVKEQGKAGKLGITPLAAVVVKASGRGRDYLAAGTYPLPGDADCAAVLEGLDVEPPEELIPVDGGRWFSPPLHGFTRFRELFTPRQLVTLCTLAQGVRETHAELVDGGMEQGRARAVCAYLAMALDRVALRSNSMCLWDTGNLSVTNAFGRQAMPMVWDFAESNPFGTAAGVASEYLSNVADIAESLAGTGRAADVIRTSATNLPLSDESFDAVITDPPYYDNISYADLSDFFYVWLKRSVGPLFPDELGGNLTPKRREAIVAPYRFGGSKDAAKAFYEEQMAAAFAEAHRVLKPGAPLVCVYAHKTTLGWSSLIDALRRAGFMITEAWPLDTENAVALKASVSALASSIFLVARRRESDEVGDAGIVRRELHRIVDERLTELVAAGIAGSDLVIATIGAALAPFTRYASVELPNGDQLPAETFLDEVQTRVLGAILRKVHGLGEGMGGLDPATRYYVLWRYSYGYADVPFDEANNLARTAGVELMDELVNGPQPLAEKAAKRTIRLLDYETRGEDLDLGSDGGRLIDVLHGLLWRVAHHPADVADFVSTARPDAERLRTVTQALQGRALRDEGESKHPEAQRCERLLGSWRTVVAQNLFSSS